MPVYAYKAMSLHGRRMQGRMEAINLSDLEARLKRMQLDLIVAVPASQRHLFAPRIPRRELINFCFHLEQLLQAKVPLLTGLGDLRDSTEHPRFREVLSGLIESINGGKRLSQAMEEHPRVFDPVLRNLIAAGEGSGELPLVLANLVDSLKWQDELAAHTKKLLLYPCFMGTMVIGTMFFMMLHLVPKMMAFVRNMGHELPLQTRLLVAVSDCVVNFWHLILLLPVLLFIVLHAALRHWPPARLHYDRLKLRLPLLGGILHKIILSRFAGVFAMMYASGIPVLDTLRASELVVGNAAMRASLARAGRLIEDGDSLSTAFQNVGVFPPLLLRMLRVGENTGTLEASLRNVSYFYTRDVRESIERVQALIEPALTVCLGLLLGWVMLSVLGPIYDVIAQLKL